MLRVDFSPARGKRLLIALSGGADSVALLHLLLDAREEYDLTLSAAHFDHGLRGEESRADADFCARLCDSLQIPLYTGRADWKDGFGEGIETAARRARYAFLNETRNRIDADFIALAHHADDQAETVLMHLFRGSGLRGAGGMREFYGALYRPLLGIRSAQLRAFLQERDFVWREDRTNAIAETPRNALRLNVLPRVEAIYPGAVQALCRFAENARTDDATLAALADTWFQANAERGPYGLRLTVDPLPPAPIFRRAVSLAVEMRDESLSHDAITRLQALAHKSSGAIEIEGGMRVERAGARLYFLAKTLPRYAETSLPIPGCAELTGLCRVRATETECMPILNDPTRQALSRDALEGAVLRTRREGDVIQPFGMTGIKTLSDYLIDRKVDRPLRDFIPLLAKGHTVYWVVGVGISQACALAPGARAIRVECDQF